ncbi:MAG TPA: hypothetical protein VHQ90_10460 [Thermoanaerobaculia bacterium]|nr:hypothetical protein [Thermoanaerobaculia bacterium]
MLSFEHQQAREILSDLSTGQRAALLHLLACPDCQRHAEEILLDNPMLSSARGGEDAPGQPDAPTRRARDESLLAALVAGWREAESLVAELLRLPPAQRLRAVQRKADLHQPIVAELLREAAEEALGDPLRCEELAHLALVVAKALPAYPPGVAERSRLRAFCLVGEARRRRGDRPGAEEAFRQAALTDGWLYGDERGVLCAGFAKLRWEEGRLDEAAALLARAAEIFGDCRQWLDQAVCRAWLGCLLLEACEPDRAVAPLCLALGRADVALPPALAQRTTLGLAYCEAALGRHERASALLAAVGDCQDDRTGAEEELVSTWWRARIAARAGSLAESEDALAAVLGRLLAQGSLREAATAALELALVRLKAGRPRASGGLGHQLFHAFGGEAARLAVGFEMLAQLPADELDLAAGLLRGQILRLRTSKRGRPGLVAKVIDLADLRERPLPAPAAGATEIERQSVRDQAGEGAAEPSGNLPRAGAGPQAEDKPPDAAGNGREAW